MRLCQSPVKAVRLKHRQEAAKVRQAYQKMSMRTAFSKQSWRFLASPGGVWRRFKLIAGKRPDAGYSKQTMGKA
jgi:hypothetical protein